MNVIVLVITMKVHAVALAFIKYSNNDNRNSCYKTLSWCGDVDVRMMYLKNEFISQNIVTCHLSSLNTYIATCIYLLVSSVK